MPRGAGVVRPPVQGHLAPQMPQAPPASSADSKYETEFKNLTSTSAFNSSSVEDKRESIGDMIYDFIQKETDEKKAPQITGMILDLPIEDLISSLTTFKGLQEKIKEGLDLLKDD